MEIRQCLHCPEKLPLTRDFWHTDGTNPDGSIKFHVICKLCKRKQNNKYYKTNPVRRENIAKRHKLHKARIRDYIKADKEFKGCQDCVASGRAARWPYYVLDYDHLPQYDKLFEISRAQEYSLDVVKAEIAKCEVVCANHHRIRTKLRID